MKIYAISDLHLSHETNRNALETMPDHGGDWLILAGDIGCRESHLEFALTVLTGRFTRILWTPGNHDLWTLPDDAGGLRGEMKYRRLVEICRKYNVLTPEDPYPVCKFDDRTYVIAPLFVLYDYSFRPAHVPADQAVAWAGEHETLCMDEFYLFPDPFPSRESWCEARCDYTERRLSEVPRRHRLVLANHFPLRGDLVRLYLIPRFSIWCGSTRTEEWHRRYNVAVVVSGHLHIPATDRLEDVRFEEVSLGYPRQWQTGHGMEAALREILPGEDVWRQQQCPAK